MNRTEDFVKAVSGIYFQDMTLTETRSRCALTVHRASKDHNGEYKCQASNQHGKTLTTCLVNVVPAFEGKRETLCPYASLQISFGKRFWFFVMWSYPLW